MTRERAQLVRLLLMCVAWAVGRTLTAGLPIELANTVIPGALAIGAYALTENLGRPGAGGGEGKYWRGRRIDEGRRGGGRYN